MVKAYGASEHEACSSRARVGYHGQEPAHQLQTHKGGLFPPKSQESNTVLLYFPHYQLRGTSYKKTTSE